MPITDFMSSEESGEDENENRIIIIKPLSWRDVSKDDKSPQSKCQMKTREIGEVSERPKPSKVASWAIV